MALMALYAIFTISEKKKWYFERDILEGGSLMTWLAISAKGKTDLVVVMGKQNSMIHFNVSTEQVVPFEELAHTEKLVFQQDNAKIYTSRYTRSFLKGNKIELVDSPAQSPSPNLVKNVW